MKRPLITVASVIAVLGATTTVAVAQQPAASGSSCVALITSFEATQLAAGAVGQEVSGLARTPGLGVRLVSPLARAHPGSIEDCLAVE